MTISLDTPAVGNDHAVGRPLLAEPDSDPCGANVDWARGLDGLPRSSGRSANVSGSLLTKVIEAEIIPRLLMAHRNPVPAASPSVPPGFELDMGNSEAFARLLLVSDPAEVVDQVESLIDRGVPLERIFLELLAPVARKLGEFWEEDRCTFTDVTLGLAHLHQVLHEISRRKMTGMAAVPLKRRAYFVPAPGEQHTFGLSMLEEFFLHAGWETASNHAATAPSILETVAREKLDIVGFSVGCKEHIDPLSDLIKRTRKASRNRNVNIMVGGKVFLDSPELAAKLGMAIVASDGVHAVRIAETLVTSNSRLGGMERLK